MTRHRPYPEFLSTLARPACRARLSRAVLLLAFGSILVAQTVAQNTYHVDASASPGGDGLSWSTAWGSLQDALDTADRFDEIWVAAGTYYPTVLTSPGNPRSATWRITSPLQIHGGFVGDETALTERDPELFDKTILSGDLGILGDSSDNAYHVITATQQGFAVVGAPIRAVLDGFRITGGNALGQGFGGGVDVKRTGGLVTPKLDLRHCTLDGNSAIRGGAVSVRGLSTVRLERCVVRDNHASNRGGAIYASSASLQVVDSRFEENDTDGMGGVLYEVGGGGNAVRFANSLFVGNAADLGGVAYLWADAGSGNGEEPSGSTPGKAHFYNCTFTQNDADVGGVIYAITNANPAASARVYNSILWGNTAQTSDPAIFGSGLNVRYSDVQGGYTGAGNVSVDPQFVDGVMPGISSPVSDAGSNDLLPDDYLDVDGDGDKAEALPLDLSDRDRRTDDGTVSDTGDAGSLGSPVVDMGAYELNYSRLEVVPFTLSAAPGTVRNYQAFGYYASASGPDVSVDVTNDVTWTSGNIPVATFSGSTLTLDANLTGYASITAEIPGNIRSRGPVMAVSTTTTEPVILYAGWADTVVRQGVTSTVTAEARVVGPVTKVFFPGYGELEDDGLDGDKVAGDRLYTWTGSSSLFPGSVGDDYLEIIATKQSFLTPQIPLWDQGYLWPYLTVGSPATANPAPGYWTFPTVSEADGYGSRLGGVGFGLTSLLPNTAGVLTLMATQESDPLTWVRTFNLGSFLTPLNDSGTGADQIAGDGLWTAEVGGLSLPESLYIVDFRANWKSPENDLGDVAPRLRVHQDL